MCYFFTCCTHASAMFQSQTFIPFSSYKMGRRKSVPTEPKSLHQTHLVPSRLESSMRPLLCFLSTEIMTTSLTQIVEYCSGLKVCEIHPRFLWYVEQNIQEKETGLSFCPLLLFIYVFTFTCCFSSSPRPSLGFGRLQQWRKSYSGFFFSRS